MDQPPVSVITPFHNTDAYLAECIESVLQQSYSNFEYILVDNCSSDRSAEIANKYAERDSRIRFIRRSTLLTQVQNYNAAIAEMSAKSRYFKIVQADDTIFPRCLELMVDTFERSERIGLVSSYWIKGTQVRGCDFPYPTGVLPGGEMARLFLRTGTWVFGSPTAVMYRASLYDKREPFYDESKLHEDTDKCMEILDQWDFGFVHQVLSFSRADNESISSAVRNLQPGSLDRYISARRYARRFFDAGEASTIREKAKKTYYRTLAHQALRLREREFWNYHEAGLATLGERLDRIYLAKEIFLQCLWMVGNPAIAAERATRFWNQKMKQNKKVTS